MSDTASTAPRVPKRVAAVILNSLKGGVVPRIGLPYITVGREVEIRALLTDLSQLGHIRSAAAQTREALLIDEEREDGTPTEAESTFFEQPVVEPASDVIAQPVATVMPQDEADEPTVSTEQFGIVAPLLAPEPAPSTTTPIDAATALDPAADAYLRALLEQDTAQAASAVAQSGQSEDMLVDNINEALFDLVGDTVIEFGAAGPQIIEDYEADVRGYLDHE